MGTLKKIVAASLLSCLPYVVIPAAAPFSLSKSALEQTINQVTFPSVYQNDFLIKFENEKLHYLVDHRYFTGHLDMEFQKAKDPNFDYDLLISLYIDDYKFVYYLVRPFIAMSGTPTNVNKITIDSHAVKKDGKILVLERTQDYFVGGVLKKESKTTYDYEKRIILRKEAKDKEGVTHINKMSADVHYYEDTFALIYNLRASAYGELKDGASYQVSMQSKGNSFTLNLTIKEDKNKNLKIESNVNKKDLEFVLEEFLLENDKKANYPIKRLEIDFHGKLKLELQH